MNAAYVNLTDERTGEAITIDLIYADSLPVADILSYARFDCVAIQAGQYRSVKCALFVFDRCYDVFYGTKKRDRK